MISIEQYREMALALPETEELPHFDLPSFRHNKKIFATYHPKTNRAMLKLPLIEQSVYCDMDSTVFFPVPGAWGAKGATFVELSKVKKTIFKEALKVAYDSLVQGDKKKKAK